MGIFFLTADELKDFVSHLDRKNTGNVQIFFLEAAFKVDLPVEML